MVAVVEGSQPDTVVAISDQGTMVVVVAGGRPMPGRAMAAVAAARVSRANAVAMTVGSRATSLIRVIATATSYRNTRAAANMRGPSTVVIVPMATGRACRLNMRINPAIAPMVARRGDQTISVTITVAVVKAVPGSLHADSLPVAVGSGIAPAADAPADDGKRGAVVFGGDHHVPQHARRVTRRRSRRVTL